MISPCHASTTLQGGSVCHLLLTCSLHVCRNIEEQKTAELRAMAQVKAKAQAMATALQTISKFIIKVIA